MTTLLPFLRARFVQAAVLYNIVLFTVFYGVYLSLDFSRHFTSDKPVTAQGKLYYAAMVHTAAGGPNDIVPKTDLARTITTAHVLLSWMQLLLVFLKR